MTSAAPRFLLENIGPTPDNVLQIVSFASQYCSSNGIPEMTLVVAQKRGFLHSVVAEALTEKFAKPLDKGQAISITPSLSLRLSVPASLSREQHKGMLIGVHLIIADMNVVDAQHRARAFAFLPWDENDGKTWLSTWNPVVWGNRTWRTEPSNMSVEVTSALGHPSDKRAAQSTFEQLRSAGHKIEPEGIRQWAMRNGWRPKDAEELAAVATKYC